MADSHSHAHDDHSHGGLGTYMGVFGGLIILTAVSFWLGNSSLKDTMPVSAWAGMMAVSCGKAMLVILFFMHLKWEANWKYVLTIPSMMMSVFLVCMIVPDIGLRRVSYSNDRIIHSARPAETHDSIPHEPDADSHDEEDHASH